LWPGFGENGRVLKWICERVDGYGKARATPIGYVPTHDALDVDGLDITKDTIHKLTYVDNKMWLEEVASMREFLKQFGDKLPKILQTNLSNLEARLVAANAAPTSNKRLIAWVEETARLCRPDRIQWCTGTEDEYDGLCDLLVDNGTFVRLNEQLRPNSFLARSDPRDVSRDDSKTFVCSESPNVAGPLNQWKDPKQAKEEMNKLFDGCMVGRTMYVIAFSLGPLGSPFSRFAVQLSDSPYVVVNMQALTTMGTRVLNTLGEHTDFYSCLHSVGLPLTSGKDVPWPCNPDKRLISVFPSDSSVMSFGSNFGSNVLSNRVNLGLRISSVVAQREGWLAERMAVLGVTNPDGRKHYIAAAIPEDAGKTNLAMMVPTLPGWTVRCVSDDIAWLHIAEDGKLYAINPEAGFFDGASGTSSATNRAEITMLNKNAIFTNVGLTAEGDIWWDGLTSTAPPEMTDWTGKKWSPSLGTPAAHYNSRYTAPASQCPVIDPEWQNPNGVPISAIVFGHRREGVYPLVTEAANWERGVIYGAGISKQIGSAPISREPFATGQFVAYHVRDYLEHWMGIKKQLGYNVPKVFVVNWFRKGADGQYLWPGFDENSRLLKWIFQRITNNPEATATKTVLGFVPQASSIDLKGTDVPVANLEKALAVDPAEVKAELLAIKSYFASLGADSLPKSLSEELNAALGQAQ